MRAASQPAPLHCFFAERGWAAQIDLKQAGFEMWKIVCKLDGDHPTKATYTANGRPCNAKELRQMLATKFHIQRARWAAALSPVPRCALTRPANSRQWTTWPPSCRRTR